MKNNFENRFREVGFINEFANSLEEEYKRYRDFDKVDTQTDEYKKELPKTNDKMSVSTTRAGSRQNLFYQFHLRFGENENQYPQRVLARFVSENKDQHLILQTVDARGQIRDGVFTKKPDGNWVFEKRAENEKLHEMQELFYNIEAPDIN